MPNSSENITFFLEEKNKINDDDDDITDDIKNFLTNNDDYFNQSENQSENQYYNDKNNSDELVYFINKESYQNNELYYNKEYNVKELLIICNYYGIDKEIKTSKCKKQDITSTIVFYESLPENFEIVQRRNKLWAYLTELKNDTILKKYVIWN